MLGITSPVPPLNQPVLLYQLTQNNNTATQAVTFSAATNTGNPINWTVSLHYQSSGGYPNPATDPSPLNFIGTSYTYPSYQSIGGQVVAMAQVTDPADGSVVSDCSTFYVEGPEGGILNGTITQRLDQLYPASSSYNQYLNDGTGTPNLMTGVAMKESSYEQFRTPAESFNPPEPDLFNLKNNFQVSAKWPVESPPATCPDGSFGPGCYIGLLQVPTTDPDAWDWTTNTQDGVNLFSGGNSDKVQAAVAYEGEIINGNKRPAEPAHINGDGSYLRALHGNERENDALVLYGGYLVPACGQNPTLACILNSLYYVPQCPPPGVQIQDNHGNLKCQGGTWQWVINSASQAGGVNYVNVIRTGVQ